MKVEIISIALCAIISLVSCSFEKPAFCGQSECPKYTVIDSTDDYELRVYEAATWVTASGDDSQRGLFMKLFRYIDGANSNERKIAMTVPVLKKYSMTGNEVVNENVMAFFMSLTSPPTPRESNMEILDMSEMRVYVRSYGWWSTDSKVQFHLQALKDALPEGTRVDTSRAYFAGYDSPWNVLDRHNEVWLIEM